VGKPIYPARVAHLTLSPPHIALKKVLKKTEFASYDLETIICAPHILELISSELLTNVVERYFQCLPTIANINLFWSGSAKQSVAKESQRFHRDVDDCKQVNFFVFLTPTTEGDGSHCVM